MTHCRSTPKENEIEGSTTFGGHSLSGDGTIQSPRVKVLSNLKQCLDNRFKDCDEGVLKAASIASFSLWPQESEIEGKGWSCRILMANSIICW